MPVTACEALAYSNSTSLSGGNGLLGPGWYRVGYLGRVLDGCGVWISSDGLVGRLRECECECVPLRSIQNPGLGPLAEAATAQLQQTTTAGGAHRGESLPTPCEAVQMVSERVDRVAVGQCSHACA